MYFFLGTLICCAYVSFQQLLLTLQVLTMRPGRLAQMMMSTRRMQRAQQQACLLPVYSSLFYLLPGVTQSIKLWLVGRHLIVCDAQLLLPNPHTKKVSHGQFYNKLFSSKSQNCDSNFSLDENLHIFVHQHSTSLMQVKMETIVTVPICSKHIVFSLNNQNTEIFKCKFRMLNHQHLL